MISFARRFFPGKGSSSLTRESAVEIISHWHSQPKERLIFDGGCDEVNQYLQAVEKIQQLASDGELDEIISMAVARLKRDFRTILTREGESVLGSNSTTELSSMTDTTSYQFRYEDFVHYDQPKPDVVDYLRSIALAMNACGHLEACIEVFKSVRKLFVDAIFKRLKLDELMAGNTKRFLPEELKMKVKHWLPAARVCTKTFFAKEKQFAGKIFSGLGRSSTHEECFSFVAKDAAVSLFSFAESVSLSHQPPGRLEVILMLYDAMLPLTEDVNTLFLSEPGKGVRNSTAATLSRLGDEVRRMLSDFKTAVLKDHSSTISDDGGRVHQLTKHVMGCINLIVNHRKILTKLIVERPSMDIGDQNFPDDELQDPRSSSPLALHLVLILAVLQLNLDNKSKYYKDPRQLNLDNKSKDYKDPSLGYLFMMNNVNYIVLEIQLSEDLQEMISADYLDKLNEKVKRAMSGYEDATCNRFLNCLEDEGLLVNRCFTPRVSNSALRRSISGFNGVFEETKSCQSSWEVQDVRLREKLRISMREKLVTAYEAFLKKYRNHLESEEHKKNCLQYGKKTILVKYSVQDLESLVLKNLFALHQHSSSSYEPVENGG